MNNQIAVQAGIRQTIIQIVTAGDIGSTEITRLTGIKPSTLNRLLTEMTEDGDIYCYRVGPSRNKRFTMDESKHTERVKNRNILPGARVFLLEDKSREDINREIMKSHGNKRHKTHVGTCWEMMLSASLG